MKDLGKEVFIVEVVMVDLEFGDMVLKSKRFHFMQSVGI